MLFYSLSWTLPLILFIALGLPGPASAQMPPLSEDEQAEQGKGISLWQPGDSGERLFIDGSVLTPDGQGIAGATIYIRQADGSGVYPPDRYRGHLTTDKDGRYAFGTVLPGQYSSVKHIHLYIQHDNYQSLDTEILFMGDSNLDETTQRRRGIFLEESTVDGETFLYGRFDIVLQPHGG